MMRANGLSPPGNSGKGTLFVRPKFSLGALVLRSQADLVVLSPFEYEFLKLKETGLASSIKDDGLMTTTMSVLAHPFYRCERCFCRQTLAVAVCLTLVVSLGSTVRANPITGTITATVSNAPPPDGSASYYSTDWFSAQSGGFASGGTPTAVDLSILPTGLPLPGGDLGYNTHGTFGQKINAPFDLKITFDGTSGSHPFVELTGTLVGEIGGTSLYANMGGWFIPTLTSAVLHDWTPDCGVPLSLINQYMNPASYHLDGAIEGGSMNGVGYLMTIDPSTGASVVPEPATVVMYLAVIGGFIAWRGSRALRANLELIW